MLETRLIRTLDLHAPSSHNRAAHLSAASGLVSVGEHWYVVADDEHHLGMFSSTHEAPGRLLRIFAGTLPDKLKPRKARKPDLEALVLLPRFRDYPSGALLALASGSRPNRQMGVLLGLDAEGAIDRAPTVFDLAELYAGLGGHVDQLNIEGAVVLGDRLRLLQRGNNRSTNAIIEFALSPLLGALSSRQPVRLNLELDIRPINLGEVAGIPLCFTDGAALPNGDMVFTAVAEDTDDCYLDGACAGSAVGILRSDRSLARIELLAGAPKVEGLEVQVRGTALHLLMVTDGDDAALPARLLATQL